MLFHIRFKDTLKNFDDFKNKQKSLWSNVFWYVTVYIFSKCIQHTIQWIKTQMLKKFPWDKISGRKNALFFLSRDPPHHSFIFNLRFWYELKHKVPLSKTVYRIFHFRLKKAIKKPHTALLPDLWFLSCNKKF